MQGGECGGRGNSKKKKKRGRSRERDETESGKVRRKEREDKEKKGGGGWRGGDGGDERRMGERGEGWWVIEGGGSEARMGRERASMGFRRWRCESAVVNDASGDAVSKVEVRKRGCEWSERRCGFDGGGSRALL